MIGKFQNTLKYRKHQTGILLFPLWGHLEFDDRNMPKKRLEQHISYMTCCYGGIEKALQRGKNSQK